MLPHAGLAILHGCLAAAFVEGLMRAWRVRAPNQRLALRALALLAPVLITGALDAAAPFRHTAVFGATWALFAGAHWDNLRLLGLRTSSLATGLLVVAGLVLFLRDALPFLRDRFRPPDDGENLPAAHPARDRIAAVIGGLPQALRSVAPTLHLIAMPGAVLYCSGVLRPVLTVSLGTLARLDDEELGAALAHELEHVRRRDPAIGWGLLAVRLLQAFNPATQIIGRQIVVEIEARADQRVADLGMAPGLARAIHKLSGAGEPRTDLTPGSVVVPAAARLAAHAAARATDTRVLRLLTPADPDGAGTGGMRFALAAAGLTVLLFLVV